MWATLKYGLARLGWDALYTRAMLASYTPLQGYHPTIYLVLIGISALLLNTLRTLHNRFSNINHHRNYPPSARNGFPWLLGHTYRFLYKRGDLLRENR